MSSDLPPVVAQLLRARGNATEVGDAVGRIIKQGLVEQRVRVPREQSSILTWLIEEKHHDQALRLLAAGADPVHAGPTGYQPIHAAASHNQRALCEALVAKGASLHAATSDGSTVLHYALADSVDAAFVDWMLGRIKSPAHALLKKGSLPYSSCDTAWEILARYGRREPELLEVLKVLDKRGLIDDVLQSTKPSARRAASNFQSELFRRFPEGLIRGWWEIRQDANALEGATLEVAAPARKMRF